MDTTNLGLRIHSKRAGNLLATSGRLDTGHSKQLSKRVEDSRFRLHHTGIMRLMELPGGPARQDKSHSRSSAFAGGVERDANHGPADKRRSSAGPSNLGGRSLLPGFHGSNGRGSLSSP